MNALRTIVLCGLSVFVLALAPVGVTWAQVKVTAADPASTYQGTVSLDVTVSGSGFDNSAKAQFFVTGTTNPGGITVKKVQFRNSKELVATIDVADTAVVTSFDIVVALSDGRKGKGTTLFAVQAKGKPVPPPPPPLPAQTCAGSPGVFPAFAYSKAKYITGKKFGGTQIWDGTDLYIANSTGSCSIPIYIGTRESSPGAVSYRQIGTEARIAWAQGSEVRLLKFHVVNGSVVETRPIPPSSVYVLNYTPSGISGVDLSRDGQTIYYPDERQTVDGRWIDTVNFISIATCSSNCSSQLIYTFDDDNGVGGVEVNDSDDRLYMSIHNRIPDIRTVSFLEKQGGTWSSPLLRHVVSDQDAAYATVNGFATTAVGKWDHDNSSVLREVVSFVVERTSGNTTDIIDVSNCSASGVSSCLGSGESRVVRSGIALSGTSFTSMPSSATDAGPNLLVVGGGWVSDVDLDSPGAASVPLVQGGGADSAD
jgi:hypothetical protein